MALNRPSDAQSDQPTDADGPLLRRAYKRAGDVDDAPAPLQRRRAWTAFLVSAGIALAEGFLRETVFWGAVVFSLVAIALGASTGELAWAVPTVVSGLSAIALLLWSLVRRWSFTRQWALLLGVLVVQIMLIVAVGQAA